MSGGVPEMLPQAAGKPVAAAMEMVTVSAAVSSSWAMETGMEALPGAVAAGTV